MLNFLAFFIAELYWTNATILKKKGLHFSLRLTDCADNSLKLHILFRIHCCLIIPQFKMQVWTR